MNQENPGCLGWLFQLLGLTAAGPALSFSTKKSVLTRAELSFYGVLKLAVGDGLAICPKVRLADIFDIRDKKNYMSHFRRISQKHIDFLLCDPKTLQPLVGVELDDSSHHSADRQERDALVEKVFQSAGLPLIRVPVRGAYTVEEIGSRLKNALAVSAPPVPPPGAVPQHRESAQPEQPAEVGGSDRPEPITALAGTPQPEPPTCPKCGVSMVLRRSRKTGQQFYGCPNYPACRETAPMNH